MHVLQIAGWLFRKLVTSQRREVEGIKTAQDRIERARMERDYYNSQVSAAQSAWSASENGNSSPILGHYSYDFAQQVHFPFNAQQVGPEFLKIARKCGIFGVCNDGRSQQVMYLIEPGKRCRLHISLLHHYFSKYSYKEKEIYLHADNCTA